MKQMTRSLLFGLILLLMVMVLPLPSIAASTDTAQEQADAAPVPAKKKKETQQKINTTTNLTWNTQLVNNSSPLAEGYVPELGRIPKKYLANPTANQFDARALPALLAMMDAAAQDGVPLVVTSAYRDPKLQVLLFEQKVVEIQQKNGISRQKAEREAARYVARPGTSEHATGLAADIISPNWYTYNNDLYDTFEDTAQFEWLAKHAADYGFILRYPKGKEDITHISYEPWHYRYVGVTTARKITETEITLEEYTTLLLSQQ